MTKKEKIVKSLLHFLLYSGGFLLLWEWLRPLKELTDTDNVVVFILFIFTSLLLTYLRIPFVITTIIKGFFICFSLNLLYFETSFFGFQWVGLMLDDIMANMGAIFFGDWMLLSDSFRSLLFFCLLALMTYLLRYWLIIQKRIFAFLGLTLGYITILDTFSPYDAKTAVIRTVLVGFTMMGILNLNRIIEKEQISRAFLSKRWFIPFVFLLSGSVLIGYMVPKANPIWPDPVPFIKSYAENQHDSSNGIKKVGYGSNDEVLGGPFQPDPTPVYEVDVDSKQYWKVETKDEYTGKGWVSSEKDRNRLEFTQEENYPIPSFIHMEVEENTSIVRPKADYNHLIYPQGLKTIQNNEGFRYVVQKDLEKIFLVDGGNSSPLKEYTVQHENPQYSLKALKETNDEKASTLPVEFLEQYTQLPVLTNRVKELALEITKNSDNWYDKAKAIEQYFNSPDFQYDQRDVAVPKENDDYVEQFLFETKKGYCDNFSSSMIVLMRSIGIPTRWVKGYSGGEFHGQGIERKKRYIITNNNAHSWVEVFFPDIGWVPFEPTKSFESNMEFLAESQNQRPETTQEQTPQAPKAEKPKEKQTGDKTERKSSLSWVKLGSVIQKSLNKYWYIYAICMIGLVLLCYVMYLQRARWLPQYYLLKFRGRQRDENFPIAFELLLRQLERRGLKRDPSVTLREYAQTVDRHFSSDEMEKLTMKYEQYVYNGELQPGVWLEVKELWENLIVNRNS